MKTTALTPAVRTRPSWRERTRGLSFWARVKSLYPVEYYAELGMVTTLESDFRIGATIAIGASSPLLALLMLVLAPAAAPWFLLGLLSLTLLPLHTLFKARVPRGSVLLDEDAARVVRDFDTVLTRATSLRSTAGGVTAATLDVLVDVMRTERTTLLAALVSARDELRDHPHLKRAWYDVLTRAQEVTGAARTTLESIETSSALEHDLLGGDLSSKALDALTSSKDALEQVRVVAESTRDLLVGISREAAEPAKAGPTPA